MNHGKSNSIHTAAPQGRPQTKWQADLPLGILLPLPLKLSYDFLTEWGEKKSLDPAGFCLALSTTVDYRGLSPKQFSEHLRELHNLGIIILAHPGTSAGFRSLRSEGSPNEQLRETGIIAFPFVMGGTYEEAFAVAMARPAVMKRLARPNPVIIEPKPPTISPVSDPLADKMRPVRIAKTAPEVVKLEPVVSVNVLRIVEPMIGDCMPDLRDGETLETYRYLLTLNPLFLGPRLQRIKARILAMDLAACGNCQGV